MAYFGKLPSGKWRTIVKKNGMQRSGTAPTKAAVKALAARFELDLGAAPKKSGNVTVGEMLDLHLAEQGYAATTLYDLRLVVGAIPDDVLEWRVADVEPFTVEQLYRRLRKDGWTPHRIRKLHMLLSSAWTHRAGVYGWSSKTMMRNVTPPATATPEVRPPSDLDVRAIFDTVDRGVAVFLRLAAVSGARRGEMCGLQWRDVSVERAEISIRRSVAHVPGEGFVTSDGKSGQKGQRTIGIDQATADLLATWWAEMEERARLAELPPPVWVFSHRAGVEPWRGDYISREFARASARAGVDTHLHGLRHFMATRWLLGGEAAMVVAQRLGHANTTTTLRTYAHYLGASDHAQAAKYAADL